MSQCLKVVERVLHGKQSRISLAAMLFFVSKLGATAQLE